MATVNVTRKNTFHLKKNVSVFAAMLELSKVPTSADVYQLGVLPREVLVTSVSVTSVVPNNAGTSAVAAIGINGTAVQTAADLTEDAGTVIPWAGDGVLLETGGIITYTPTYGGTAPTTGTVLVLIEYIEYTQSTGELTNFVD